MDIKDNFIKTIIKYLPEDKVTEFEIMLEIGDKKKISEFIASLLPSLEKIADEHIEEILPRTNPPLDSK